MKLLPMVIVCAAVALIGCPQSDECEIDADCADIPCPDGEVGFCNDSGECECESGGTGGTGGSGATGGTGGTAGTGGTGGGTPSTCGFPVDSTDPGLASNIQVFLNDQDVTGANPPPLAEVDDVIRVEFVVTSGTRFVQLGVLSQEGIPIAADAAEVTGGSDVSMDLTVFSPALPDETIYGVSIALDNAAAMDPPTRAELYNTVVPACDAVERESDDNGSFTGPFDTDCTPSCFEFLSQ